MFIETYVENWEDAKNVGRMIPEAVFRGQSNAGWPLASTIERAATRNLLPPRFIKGREDWLIRQFQRRAHHFISDPPLFEFLMDWLALLQHHGGPTRLLDFTHSFYVAAFFALEHAVSDAAIWCIDVFELQGKCQSICGTNSLYERIDEINDRHITTVNEYISGKKPENLVIDVEPFRLSDRVSIQQGLFLFPCNLETTFEKNLCVTFGLSSSGLSPTVVIQKKPNEILNTESDIEPVMIKIILPHKIHAEALWELHNMNINSYTLFPGLDGYARSLSIYMKPPSGEGFTDPIINLFK